MKVKEKYRRDERLGFWHNFLYEYGITFLIVFCNSYGLIMLYNRLIRENLTVMLFSLAIIMYLVFGCLFSAVLVYITRARVYSRNIQMLCKAAQRVADGDFTVRLEVYENKISKTEIDLLKEDFNKMVIELSSLEGMRDGFISDVSHEIKTPLSVIQGYVTLLEDSTISKEKRNEYVHLISMEIHKLSSLVTNVLKINRVENQSILQKEWYSLDEQIRCCILNFEREIEEKKITLETDLKEIDIYNDKTLLEIVWNNLLSNAVKFTEQKGRIEVFLDETDKEIIVSVGDDGCGIKKEYQKEIFEKFYQVDTSHSQEGNGLGLSLVKKITEKLNGEVSVVSEENEGATFIIKLKK